MRRFTRDRNFRFVWFLAAFFSIAAPLAAADLPLKPPPELKTPPAVQPPAKQPVMPPAKTEQAPDDDFAKLPGTCIEATDGCRTWRRAADGKFDPLNNIGIACQPKPPVCTSSK